MGSTWPPPGATSGSSSRSCPPHHKIREGEAGEAPFGAVFFLKNRRNQNPVTLCEKKKLMTGLIEVLLRAGSSAVTLSFFKTVY